jgi:hypothetical protein
VILTTDRGEEGISEVPGGTKNNGDVR